MLNQLITSSIANRGFVTLASLGVGLLGVWSMLRLPLDAVPDLTNVQVQVITETPGLSPLEVEANLSLPVESVMGGLPNVEQVRSVSKFGISVVTIVFHEGTDLLKARQTVAERLPMAAEAIPRGLGQPQLGPMATALGEIYQFQVVGDGYSPMELRSILDWFIAPQLRTVPGVTEVNAHGGEVKTFEIRPDPDALAERGLTLDDLSRAVERDNLAVGGGYLVSGGEARYIRSNTRIERLEDLAAVTIAERNGVPIRVGDVAEVVAAPLIRAGLVTRDGQGEVVTGLVMMLLGENSRLTVEAVKAELERLKTGLPPGVRIEPLYDRATLVDQALRTVKANLTEGGLLVIAVLLALLGNLRAGLMVAAVIPLSMCFAANLMLAFGVTASLMSLGAIDFGLIVDSSVIMIENCARRLGLEGGLRPQAEIVRDAAIEVRKPTLFGELIIAIVYLPILTLAGTEGKLFRPMALTVVFALVGSMIFSMTLMPALAAMLLKVRHEEREVLLVRLIKRVYEPFLDFLTARPLRALIPAVLLLGLTLPLAWNLGAEFMPKLNEGDLLVEMVRIPSAALEEVVPVSSKVETILKRFPEVQTVYSKTGRPEIANDVMGVHQTDVWVLLKPQDQWRADIDREGLIEQMSAALEREVVGARFGFTQPIEMRVNELVAGVKSDVAAILSGPDLSVLAAKAEEIGRVMEAIPGATDLKVPSLGRLPTLTIVPRRERLAMYGLSTRDVQDVVEALGGKPVGLALEGQARRPIQIRYPLHWRTDPEAIGRIRVVDRSGRPIPLSELADIRLDEGPSEVERERMQRRAVVGVNVRGRDIASFVAEAEEAIRKKVELPPGTILRWGGQFEHLETARTRLMIVTPMALILIFMLLNASVGSWSLTCLIALALPMAATGGVFALAVRNLPFSISAAVGFIALFGVAVLNGLVWVSAAERLRKDEAMSPADAARHASLERLRPILMTAFTGGFGFLPMALATTPGAEIQRPLATVVIGGLITSTLLTTLVLPTIYPWFAPRTPPPPHA